MADSIHVDVCPECGMPFHGHGLDPPPHHQCKVDYEDAVPALYVPVPSLDEIEALLEMVHRDEARGPLSAALGDAKARLVDMRDELNADADGPYRCTGADYHDPNCGGTCGAG